MILTFWAIIIQSHLVILATDGGLKSQHIVVRMPCEIATSHSYTYSSWTASLYQNCWKCDALDEHSLQPFIFTN